MKATDIQFDIQISSSSYLDEVIEAANHLAHKFERLKKRKITTKHYA